jgi:transcriptional regulator with XRE-family HTH domain
MASDVQELIQVKNRILGVLLKDAREASGRDMADCASLLGISEEDYRAMEVGLQSPTLPQLEILAYVFNLPIDHFWGTDTLASQRREEEIKDRVPDLLMLRQRIIGLKLRQLREKAGMTVAQVAEKTGIGQEDIEAVEEGMIAYPVHALELLARTVQGGLNDLREGHGPVGNWLQAQKDFDAFLEMPSDLREFVLKPINRSYLDLAIRLSNMEVNKLRTIAESILEITY